MTGAERLVTLADELGAYYRAFQGPEVWEGRRVALIKAGEAAPSVPQTLLLANNPRTGKARAWRNGPSPAGDLARRRKRLMSDAQPLALAERLAEDIARTHRRNYRARRGDDGGAS